jgi:hypothetical protein
MGGADNAPAQDQNPHACSISVRWPFPVAPELALVTLAGRDEERETYPAETRSP